MGFFNNVKKEWQDWKGLLLAILLLDCGMVAMGKNLSVAISGLLMLVCIICLYFTLNKKKQ